MTIGHEGFGFRGRRYAGILFDMDGLVLDSERTYVTAWRRAAETFGKSLDSSLAERLFGRHADDVARLMGEILGPDFERNTFFAEAERHWFEVLAEDGIDPMPGAQDLIVHLQHQRIPFALATNSDRHYAERCLRAGGMEDAFPIFISRDQVSEGKPAPDLFLEAARRLTLPPEDCLVLEDSETGLKAARAAGCQPVLIQQRPALRDTLSPLADHVFPDLRGFLSALAVPKL